MPSVYVHAHLQETVLLVSQASCLALPANIGAGKDGLDLITIFSTVQKLACSLVDQFQRLR